MNKKLLLIMTCILSMVVGALGADIPFFNSTDTEDNLFGARITVLHGLSGLVDHKSGGSGYSIQATYKVTGDVQATLGYIRENYKAKGDFTDHMGISAVALGGEYTFHVMDDWSFVAAGELGRSHKENMNYVTELPNGLQGVERLYDEGDVLYYSFGAFARYIIEDGTYLHFGYKHRNYGTFEGRGGRWAAKVGDEDVITDTIEAGIGWEF